MRAYYKSLILFIAFLIIFECGVYMLAFERPYWGDEIHFVETINHFGKNMGLNTIKHYNEMSTPLPFMLYALWGRIFGFEIHILRILSVIIAVATYILFHWLLFLILGNIKVASLTSAFLVLHPYMVGLSVFVFTDVLPILFMMVCCISIIKQNPIGLAISLSCALLSRQYFIFFTIAAGLSFLFRFLKKKNANEFQMLLSCVISLLPFAVLVYLWKGLSPDNSLRDLYLNDGYSYHPSFLALYVCQFFVYLFPVIILCWKSFYKDIKHVAGCFIVSWIYWLFPVAPCKAQIEANIHTVGFFHKFLTLALKIQFLENLVFYLMFLLGLPIVFYFMKDFYLKWRREDFDFSFLLDLSILLFLIVMPFSYLCWEKYFLPLVPLASIRILLTKFSDQQAQQA